MTNAVGTAGNDGAVEAPFVRWLVELTRTRAYDVLIRVLFVAWILFVEYFAIGSLAHFVGKRGAVPDALYVSNILARTAVILFLATMVVFMVLRSRPALKARGLRPRVTALAGTLLPMAFAFFPVHEDSLAVSVLSAVLVFSGNGLAIYVVTWLGRSYSTMAEARQLKTDGPYAIVRHPLYLAEEIAVFGAFLLYASPWTALMLLAHMVLQIQRMKYEEAVLGQAFPGYRDFARGTARIIPGVY